MTRPSAPVPVLVDVDGVIRADAYTPTDLDHWPADTWKTIRVPVTWAGVTVDVTYSTAVIDGLRRIEALPSTQMHWCTTWRADAATSLAPAIGIGTDWPVMNHDLPAEFAWTDWWKAARALELARSHEGRLLWIDDQAALWAANMLEADHDRALDLINANTMILSPDLRRGLTAEHFAEIEEFLA